MCANVPPKEDSGSSWACEALNPFLSFFSGLIPQVKRRAKGKLKLTATKKEEGFIQEGRMVDQGKQKPSRLFSTLASSVKAVFSPLPTLLHTIFLHFSQLVCIYMRYAVS